MHKSILVIPDQHVEVGQDLRRFKSLGKLIAKRLPDRVINLGDGVEMGMLFGISARKKSYAFNNKTAAQVEAEIAHYLKANTYLWQPLDRLTARLKKSRKKQPSVHRTYCKGNHCDRAFLYHGFNTKDFKVKDVDRWFPLLDYWDEMVDYQSPVVYDGIVFSHNFVNGTATASTCDTILKLNAQSAVAGHSHKAEFKATYTATGRPIFGLQAGWFADPDDDKPDWVGPQGGSDWVNGVFMLNGVDGTGYFEPEFISTERLLREYK